MNSKITIGSEEWISLSDLNIPYIKARIDSGAKTSSLHALNIQPYQKDGQTWVSFDVYPIQNDGKRRVKCNALVTDKRIVQSSTGNR
jgi:ribosomal protein S6--L-glutamate ligase